MDEMLKFVVDDTNYETKVTKKFIDRKPYAPKDLKKVTAVISGTVLELKVKKGETVKRSTLLMLLEAMKMQNKVEAQIEGTIKKIYVKAGQRVAKGDLLLEFE